MSLGLADALIKLEARESGGIVAAGRLDYQKNWAICKILELHEQGNDYIVICEFHDDIAVLDDPIHPGNVTFYQIKTDAKGKWTISRLISRAKGAGGARKPSVLGNLCGKMISLNGYNVECRFASNARFRIESVYGRSLEESDRFSCAEVNDVDRNALKESLIDELGAALPPSFEKTLGFEVADLGLSRHDELTLGRLVKFLERYAPGGWFQIAEFYRVLFDEIRIKTNAERPSTSFREVGEAKGISRAKFDEMLRAAMRSTPMDRTTALIQDELSRAGVSLGERRRLLQAITRYFVRRWNANDIPLQRICKLAMSIAASMWESNEMVTVADLAQAVLTKMWPSEDLRLAQLTEIEVKALVMVEYYEGRGGEV